MLNADYKEQAIKDLTKIDQEYSVVFKHAVSSMERLLQTRKIAVRTIQNVEKYIVGIANRPRNYDTKVGQIKLEYINFLDAIKEIEELERKQTEKATMGYNGLAGALSGIGVATLAPTAAMSVAMTFGTASTGTAIATLSGAAATNAALAWLGGGAVAAGGAGILGGQAVVALAGPVGWAISGLSLAASLVSINMSNKEIAKKAEESISVIKKEMERIKEIDAQVTAWNAETKELSNLISAQVNRTRMFRKRDYRLFTDSELSEITSLLNSTEVLSKKLSDKIEGETE